MIGPRLKIRIVALHRVPSTALQLFECRFGIVNRGGCLPFQEWLKNSWPAEAGPDFFRRPHVENGKVQYFHSVKLGKWKIRGYPDNDKVPSRIQPLVR